MEYALLFGVIVFLAVMIGYGYKRGFVKIVLSMVAMLVTIILATILTIPVSKIVADTSIGKGVRESVDKLVVENKVIDVSSISNMELPDTILNPIIEGAENTTETLQTYVATALADTIIKAITFLVLVIVIYIIIKIVISVLNIVTKLPILNGVNRGAGAVVGLIQGLLFLWIGCLLLAACGDKEWAQYIFEQINNNSLLETIYNNNMIILLITKVL